MSPVPRINMIRPKIKTAKVPICMKCTQERERQLEALAAKADMTVSKLANNLTEIGMDTIFGLRELPSVKALEIVIRETAHRIVMEMATATRGREGKRRTA